MTEIHFIDVGCGNMQLILLPDGLIFMYDCNITNDNKDDVLSYVRKILGSGIWAIMTPQFLSRDIYADCNLNTT